MYRNYYLVIETCFRNEKALELLKDGWNCLYNDMIKYGASSQIDTICGMVILDFVEAGFIERN